MTMRILYFVQMKHGEYLKIKSMNIFLVVQPFFNLFVLVGLCSTSVSSGQGRNLNPYTVCTPAGWFCIRPSLKSLQTEINQNINLCQLSFVFNFLPSCLKATTACARQNRHGTLWNRLPSLCPHHSILNGAQLPPGLSSSLRPNIWCFELRRRSVWQRHAVETISAQDHKCFWFYGGRWLVLWLVFLMKMIMKNGNILLLWSQLGFSYSEHVLAELL